MHVILVYFSLSWTCESKMTFKISYGLTYNSMNWSNLCICYTFEEWNFVYCTVFSRISRKCRNFCDLRAYFTKWEISCNIVWLSYQNPKYRVISCVSKKSISLRGDRDSAQRHGWWSVSGSEVQFLLLSRQAKMGVYNPPCEWLLGRQSGQIGTFAAICSLNELCQGWGGWKWRSTNPPAW